MPKPLGGTAVARRAAVDEIADFVAALAGPGASHVTGAGLAIDGGDGA